MDDLGWTESSFFESKEDEAALQHAVARYHALVFLHPLLNQVFDHFCKNYSFLDLMASSPVSFFVPTLDIDLGWHTHQLMAKKYQADCKLYIGRFVDQFSHLKFHLIVQRRSFPATSDDKVEENQLATAFDLTCRAWQVRFTHFNARVILLTMAM